MVEFDDYRWLIGDEAGRLLESIASDIRPLHQQIRALRKTISSARALLLTQQLDLRQRAQTKFGLAAREMFFLPEALEQATDLWIARYKAGQFPADRPSADYCTGIGGDLCGLAERAATIGCERSPTTAFLAAENVRRWPAATGEVAVRVTDAADCPPTPDVCWHLDPDRRAQGRRTTTVEAYEPGVELIDRWRRDALDGVVKLAPASMLPPDWASACEAEWISRDRVCRQQLAWFGGLARCPGQRRATQISVDAQGDWAAASVSGRPTPPAEAAERADAVLFEPDPAVIAAGLVGHVANRHGLAQLGLGSVYLTGPTVVDDPLLASFCVEDALPLREAVIRKYLRDRNVGVVEVKRRGVETDPGAFRRALKLRGDATRTVVLTRIDRHATAIVCRRVH